MATKSKTYQDTIDIADTTRGAKSALVPMAARKATSADTVDTKQENLPDHSEEGGFATRAQPGWLCKTPRGGSRTMAVQRVALQGGSGAMAMTRVSLQIEIRKEILPCTERTWQCFSQN